MCNAVVAVAVDDDSRFVSFCLLFLLWIRAAQLHSCHCLCLLFRLFLPDFSNTIGSHTRKVDHEGQGSRSLSRQREISVDDALARVHAHTHMQSE